MKRGRVIILHNNRYMQKLLKELLMQVRIISSNGKEKNNKIINIFSLLLNEEYNEQTFENTIKKLRNTEQSSAKKVVQLLYDYIINENSVPKEIIEDYILRLKPRSRFYGIKNHLLKKVEEISAVRDNQQKVDLNKLKTNIIAISVEDGIPGSIIKALDSIANNLPISIIKLDISELTTFFKILESKLNKICEKINYENFGETNTKALNISIKQISSKFKLISSQICSTEGQLDNSIKACIKICKRVRTLSSSVDKQLALAVNNSNDKAYDLKAFKMFYDNHFKILEEAKKRLNKIKAEAEKMGIADFYGVGISTKLLDKYGNIIKNKGVRVFNKKFFDKSIREIRRIVKNKLNKITGKSMFRNSIPTKKQILNKLYSVIKKKLTISEF